MEKPRAGAIFEWLGEGLIKIKGSIYGKILIKGCVYTGIPDSQKFNTGSFFLVETGFNWNGINRKKKSKKFSGNVEFKINKFSKNLCPDLRDLCLKRGSLVQHVMLTVLRGGGIQKWLDFFLLTFIFNQTAYVHNAQRNRMIISKFVLKHNNRKKRESVGQNIVQGFIGNRVYISLFNNQHKHNPVACASAQKFCPNRHLELYPLNFFFNKYVKHIDIIMINWKIRKIKELVDYLALKIY
mmetsp:Transcript_61254/g.126537  ORF Transcript_61254/g.126537 Transcript_61254/m.126537 type:complete len:240 (-) Transcript_61254:35-754(-)